MRLDAEFFSRLSRLRLAMGQRTAMNLTGNRKSTQKGSSMEFSDFREYMPGDDIRRIDWNAYGRLDRLYVKEYMEEKEAVVSILIDTSASMEYGARKKSGLACMLAAAFSYMSLGNMDRVLLYDMQKMHLPFAAEGGKRALPRLADWLERRRFEGTVDIPKAVGALPAKGSGVTILLSDFLQEGFLEKEPETLKKLLAFLNYRKQRVILLHVLAEEELFVEMTGTRNLIDMEDQSTLRLTLDRVSIRNYESALQEFLTRMGRECARAGAFYGVCSTGTDIYQLIFQDLRMLYDI
ncbi:MAG: DUF58 domain-containing protein [Lachnospiraceae bacterium]|nr:DUF58 domain-containing protein [Lachnospiraceae bacterium]